MQRKENQDLTKKHNSSNYYLWTLLIGLIGGAVNIFLSRTEHEFNINLLFFVIGGFIALIGISFVISFLICSVRYIFLKEWKNFPKILFYTSLIVLALSSYGNFIDMFNIRT